MATKVSNAARSTEVQSMDARLDGMDLRMAKASMPVHSGENADEQTVSADVVSLVVETLQSIGMSDKEACILMAFDQSQYSRVKRNEARLPIDALWRLPAHFWSEFARRAGEAKGITAVSERRAKAARIGELVRLLVEIGA